MRLPDGTGELPLLGKDVPWREVEGAYLLVCHFYAYSGVENGKVRDPDKRRGAVPYALLTVECAVSHLKALLPVCHREDFTNLWEALKERPGSEGEEVAVRWCSDYRSGWLKLFAAYLPKLQVMVFRKGTRDRLEDWQQRGPPGEEGARELVSLLTPIAKWVPRVFRD